MKNAILFLSTLALVPFKTLAGTPGYLTDYQYQVTQVATMAEAQKLMDLQSTETRKRSICASRAHFWAYDLYRKRGVQVGKVFIHFTPKGQADENGEWAYHVAPYIIVNGEEIVLDSGFWHFEGKPTSMSAWSDYFGKSKNCVVLDPINNPAHLKLEQNNMPNDWTLPKDYRSGNSRQYPTPKGSTCYIRKVPAYYAFPVDVYGADLYTAGDATHSMYYRTRFDVTEVLDACNQAMDNKFKRDHSCEDYFGLKSPKK